MTDGVALGPYLLGERLAVGGMAEVFLATRTGPGGFQKPLVIKRLLPALAADPDFVVMFTEEARLMARLSHANLISVFDYGEADGQHYLVMEWVDGATLAQVIARRAPLAPALALHLAAELCRALDYVHGFAPDGGNAGVVHRDVTPGNGLLQPDAHTGPTAGVVHRDVTPGNGLLQPDAHTGSTAGVVHRDVTPGNRLLQPDAHTGSTAGVVHRDVTPGNVFLGRDGTVKLGDFGIAKARGRATVTARGHLKGTLAYMAPEQARGEEVDGRADLYAVGLILFELLSGRRFLPGENEAALLSAALAPPPLGARALGLPEAGDLESLLRRALCPAADGRFARADHFERALRQAAAARQPGVGPREVAALLAGSDGVVAPAAPGPGRAPAGRAAPAPRARMTLAHPAPARRRVRSRWLAAALGVALAAGAAAAWRTLGMIRAAWRPHPPPWRRPPRPPPRSTPRPRSPRPRPRPCRAPSGPVRRRARGRHQRRSRSRRRGPRRPWSRRPRPPRRTPPWSTRSGSGAGCCPVTPRAATRCGPSCPPVPVPRTRARSSAPARATRR